MPKVSESLAEIMRVKLLNDFLGKTNAKKRIELLSYLRYFEPGLKDRSMRRAYGKLLPINYCREGIYVVDDPREVDKAINTKELTKATIEESIDRLKDYKQFLIRRNKEREMKQMRLPI